MYRYAQVVNLSETVLMWIFLIVCVGALFMSLLLWYHWTRYRMKDPVISFAQILYFLGLLILSGITLILLL